MLHKKVMYKYDSGFSFNIFYYNVICLVCVSVCMVYVCYCMCLCVHVPCTCGKQRTTCKNMFSSCTMWVTVVELRSSELTQELLALSHLTIPRFLFTDKPLRRCEDACPSVPIMVVWTICYSYKCFSFISAVSIASP